ncbi:Acyl-coenzyme A thioesterase 9, mitochondrial [Gaertneriomyces sp. JEL0708]|nr:Acyl-coenzyme A thioesterase 9, mitochondrial [Gaertneriomyces sp. JEL0708]
MEMMRSTCLKSATLCRSQVVPIVRRSCRAMSVAAGDSNARSQAESPAVNRWQMLPFVGHGQNARHRMWINRFLAEKKAKSNSPAPAGPVSSPGPPKSMHDSYLEQHLLFKSDPDLREEYINPWGGIRVGKVLEDLDAMAGSVAYLHCEAGEGSSIPTIVTASLDRIDMLRSIPIDEDIRLSGHVTYTGSSSMEVSCWLETLPNGVLQDGHAPTSVGPLAARKRIPGKPILAAKFTMVARDPTTGRAAQVTRLQVETPEEERLFKLGEAAKARKMQERKSDLRIQPPSFEEMSLIHSLYKEYIQYLDPTFNKNAPESVVWMKDTIQQNLVVCMPQSRNIHGNVFGGHLLRSAFELAFATGQIFTSTHKISFVALDDISFTQPVHVGNLLHLTSQVVYSAGSESRSFQVKVRADVEDPSKNLRRTTNTFHFTFACHESVKVRRVLPRSYDESMRYIEGKRKKERWMHVAQHNISIFPELARSQDTNDS